jgi:uncharacterized protein (TIGR02271 family)
MSAGSTMGVIEVASRKKRTQIRSTQRARQGQIESLADEQFEKNQVVVPLLEEQLAVKKDRVQAGEVILRKAISSHMEELPVELAHDEVQVDRVAVNRVLEDGESAEPYQDGEVWVIPVVHEELVVLKRRLVAEEIRVTRRRATREKTVRGEVRREEITIDTTGDLNYRNSEGSLANPQ